ncbi:MAG: monovalent cation/H+ antiporter subunit D [Burkholderiales bacterium]
MNHLVIVPVLLPLLTAALLLVAAPRLAVQRVAAIAATLLLAAVSVALLSLSADDAHRVYALGAWPAPFGIVLVLDRTSALFVTIVSLVALGAVAAAAGGWDARGRYFHALFQFQLAGLNGAFLTADLFNLFVFFEVLLIASYCLLLHGLGAQRLRAAVHYVVINLTASALFLVAVATLYGLTGTLNMADLATRVAELPESDAPFARAAGLLLFAVFAVKAAMFPLQFWLPATYAAACAPVAALFAVMTKVGLYAIARVYPLVFGDTAGAASLLEAPLMPLALVTLALGAIGALAAARLGGVVACFTVVSAGTVLVSLALLSQAGVAAALYYMAHSSFALAALFLVAGLFAAQRGAEADRLAPGPALAQPGLLGMLLLVGALSIAGLPPLSGFVGKLLILQAARGELALWTWSVVLGATLLAIVCLTRAGSLLVWNSAPGPARAPGARALEVAPVVFLLGCSVAMAAFAAPLHRYTDAAAAQLLQPAGYINAVLSAAPERRVRAFPDAEARR